MSLYAAARQRDIVSLKGPANPYHALQLVGAAEPPAFMCITKGSLNVTALTFAARGYDVNLPTGLHIRLERLRVAAQALTLLLRSQ